MRIIRIATRRSQLALWQANYVAEQLEKHHLDLQAELVEITTQGDKTLDVPLSSVGGKGLFLKELEQALLDGRADIAVHSMKDVTVILPDGLHIPVICERADPRDAFVSNKYVTLDELPDGARVGTCSLRRQCLLRHAFPHLDLINLRGNVNTRLKKLDDGEFDAIVLACSGLQRLKMQNRIAETLSPELLLPAVGQGALGIECRQDDEEVNVLLKILNHYESQQRVFAERAANAELNGGCHVPVGLFAQTENRNLWLRGMVGSLDGEDVLYAEAQGNISDAQMIGERVGRSLLEQGADKILQAVYAGN